MTLYKKQSLENINIYKRNIENIARFSRLFSSSSAAPYLVSRSTENIYEESLNARNLSRDDTSIDAILDNVGVGIKTFLHNNGNTLQKIAEFNRDSSIYKNLMKEDMIIKISELRNDRLQFAIDNYGIDSLIYHCITRKNDGVINFYEIPMHFINIQEIKNIKLKENSISFEDGINEYNFNLTKSTLFMRFPFTTDKYLVDSLKVQVIDEPFSVLSNLLNKYYEEDIQSQSEAISVKVKPYIILPLYSYNKSTGKFIPERSGLNQWNAKGRKRHPDEVYIPISRKIHRNFPGFFPNRDTSFSLILPNDEILNAKISQDGDKALMTNPNKDLGKWLLRDILKLKESELLTYTKLSDIGIDSVKIVKNDDLNYSISFCESGTYDLFASDFGI